jgi:predicted DNA-binding protein (MmcQ/YjbR family)
MAKNINDAVREVCLSFPEAEEFVSHGSPNFRVRKGKTFATYVVNHHGDGRVALWLNAPGGAQAHYTGDEPKHFFIPPYVGPRGWLGVHLNKGLSWKRIASLVRQAYEKAAPPRLVAQIGETVEIVPPKAKLSAAEFDPLQAPRARQVLKAMRAICLALPEASEGRQFGSPVWRAGKKVFAQAYAYDHRLRIAFWVGVDKQGFYTADPRFEIPPYTGHNGWIALDVRKSFKVPEVRALALESYRHFALRRMLAKLEEA